MVLVSATHVSVSVSEVPASTTTLIESLHNLHGKSQDLTLEIHMRPDLVPPTIVENCNVERKSLVDFNEKFYIYVYTLRV